MSRADSSQNVALTCDDACAYSNLTHASAAGSASENQPINNEYEPNKGRGQEDGIYATTNDGNGSAGGCVRYVPQQHL